MRNKEDQQIIEMLESLRETPSRDPRSAVRGRARFLAEASSLRQAVSLNAFQRLKNWIAKNSFTRHRKERSPMLATISSIVIALALVLGGGGITAYAAQDSLPDDVLYPVKLYLEDARLGLTDDPAVQIRLLTTFANNRADEIAGLAQQGEAVPNGVLNRLQTHLRTMLQLAAGMDEESSVPTLFQVQQTLRTQEQFMNQLGRADDLDPALEQLRAMLQEQHRLIQAALDEPLQFQQQYHHGESEPPGSPSEITEPKGNQYGDCSEPGECEPAQDGTGPGPGEPGGNSDTGNDDPGGNKNQGEDKPPDSGGPGNGNGGESGGKGSGSGK